MSIITKYDWKEIQEFYDTGASLRSVKEKFGCHWKSIGLACTRGEFKKRSQKQARSVSKKSNYKHTEEFKQSVSRRQSEKNSGGRCKWYIVDGKSVQGTWERNVALKLNDLGIGWSRPKSIPYHLDGKTKRYCPDFLLTNGLYLEIKGHWWGDDRRKMDAVIEQHPGMKILILEKNLYERFLGGELVW